MSNNGNEVVEIEKYAREEKQVPKENVTYRFKVGNKIGEHTEPLISGREILTKVGLLPPEQYQLNLRFKKGRVEVIQLDQLVDLTENGLERFVYMKLDQTEGCLL